MNLYYKLLNEKFDKLLTEEQQVVINFKNIFGSDVYEVFKAKKNRLSNPQNDVSYWVSRYNEEGNSVIDELSRLLKSNKVKRDIEGERIPEPANTKEKVAENDFYVVYHVDDMSDMIDLAMTKVNGFAGGYWCIAGRYGLGAYAEREGIDKDDAVKVSQAENYFDDYLEDNYQAYFVCMPKDEDHQKHCLCFRSDTICDDWNTSDEHNAFDEDFDDIPEFEFDGMVFKGKESVESDERETEYMPEPDPEHGEEDMRDHGPEHHEHEQAPAYITIDVENPNEYEFPARNKEEAARAFKDGAEIIETVREPDLHIVKWHEEPVQEGDAGDRFALFVFIPGEGGGPLLAQTGRGFALQVFKELEKAREFAGRMPGVEIINNRRETEDMPECLRENFYYYNDNSWYYDL